MSFFKAFKVTKPVCDISWRKPKRTDGKWAKRNQERKKKLKGKAGKEDKGVVIGPALKVIKDARMQAASSAPGSVRAVRRDPKGTKRTRKQGGSKGRGKGRARVGRISRMSALLKSDIDAETARRVARGPRTMTEEINDTFKSLQKKVEGTRRHGGGERHDNEQLVQAIANSIKADTRSYKLTYRPDKVLKRQGGVTQAQQQQQEFVFQTAKEKEEPPKKKAKGKGREKQPDSLKQAGSRSAESPRPSADEISTHGGGAVFDFSKTKGTKKPHTLARELPQLFFNAKKLKPLLEDFTVHSDRRPKAQIITGPSGSGKSWALAQIASYWRQCTSSASVLTVDNFEDAVDKKLPFPVDDKVLLALDDVDALMPSYMEKLRKLLAKKKHVPIIMTATDVYAMQKLAFLRRVPRCQLYRSTYPWPLKTFVKSLRLRPPPPESFVDRVISLSNGNLHRIKNMLVNHRSQKTLAAADDQLNIWQEEKLFRKGKLLGPCSDRCALMVQFNAPDNCRTIKDLAEVTERFSTSLRLHDPWLYTVGDVSIQGQNTASPRPYMALTTETARLKNLAPDLCNFFSHWGCMPGTSELHEKLELFQKHWDNNRKKLKHKETIVILERCKKEASFLKTVDDIMHKRKSALRVKLRKTGDGEYSDPLLNLSDPDIRRFLLG